MDFVTQASTEGWPGIGSPENPYEISNYEINATSNPDSTDFSAGIYIGNTTVYFKITGCYVHNAGNGIKLFNVTSGSLTNNDCSFNSADSGYGIWLVSCEGIAICNNSCSNNDYGIFVQYSDRSTILNNNCSANVYGLWLYYSNWTMIIDNNFLSNREGIEFLNSNWCTAERNDCIGNSDCGMMLWESSNHNALSNNNCSGNGCGIYFYICGGANVTNNRLSANGYGLLLVTSADNTISGNNCSFNGGPGIYLHWSSDNNAIIDNFCTSNGDDGILLDNQCNLNGIIANNCSSNSQNGIRLLVSFGNTICLNQFYCNTLEGLSKQSIYSGQLNVIWNNTFVQNNGAGLNYNASHIQASDDGVTFWYSAVYGNYWSDWTSPDTDFDGVVDLPYNISGETHQYDPYPLTAPRQPLLDYSPPVTTLVLAGTLGSDGWYVSSLNVTLTASDNPGGSGVGCIKYRLDNGVWLDYSAPIAVSGEGIHVISYFSIDSAGNRETWRFGDFRVDRTKPIILLEQLNGTVFRSSAVDLSWTVFDNTSGVNHFEVSLDYASFDSLGLANTQWNITGLSDGTHTFVLRAIDNAGNVAEQMLTFKVDTSRSGPGGAAVVWLVLGSLVALVVVALALLLILRRHKSL